jgi:hypothetical protein
VYADLGCAFKAALMIGGFGCRNAMPVTRREGPDVVCHSEDARRRCSELLTHLKAAALPAFGVADDLLSMPHGVMVKIQCGGLLGLNRLLIPGSPVGASIEDVAALVDRALDSHGDVGKLPYESLVQDMVSHKLRRRGSF